MTQVAIKEVHVSSMRNFEQCLRLFDWTDRNHSNLTPDRPYPPFFFGSLAHFTLQQYYQYGLAPAYSFSHFLRPYVKSLGAIWTEERRMIANETKMCRLMLEHYFLWARSFRDPFCDKNLDYLATEQNFKVHLYDDVYFAGRWDGLARHKESGRLYLVEYKTARSIEERIDTLQLDDQATGYAWAAQQILGEPVQGVIYNVLRKAVPPMPEVLKNGQLSQNKSKMTAEWFVRAIRRKYKERANDVIRTTYYPFIQRLLDEGQDYFKRAVVYKTQKELEMVGKKIHGRSRAMLEQQIEEWERSPAWHCRRCLFKEPCMVRERGGDYTKILAEEYHYRQDAFLTVDDDVIALEAMEG